MQTTLPEPTPVFDCHVHLYPDALAPKAVGELARRGRTDIPDHFVPACHLIYSSPATISYN